MAPHHRLHLPNRFHRVWGCFEDISQGSSSNLLHVPECTLMQMIRHATLVVLSAALLTVPTSGFRAPAPASRRALLRTDTTPVAARTPVMLSAAMLSARSEARASLIMASAVTAPQARPWATAGRLALLLMASVFGLLLRALPAFAVSTVRRSASSAGLPVGAIVKYGSVLGLFGAAYAFRTEETPILTETPNAEQPAGEQASGVFTETDAAPAAPGPALADDSSLNSALVQRMRQLAEEKERADSEEVEDSPPPLDSTDGWGTGDTALLERPSADDQQQGSVLDGEPAVEFPPGFPLVDADWETEPAQASDDQIAMLNRMFGGDDSATE